MAKTYDVVVIGSGPGGYVAGIRCAQLGMKTAVVEREKLGGVCLNVGCIPSKAMIGAASFLEKMKVDAPKMGFGLSKIDLDMGKLQEWKSSVCNKMSGGVSQLLKGNGCTVHSGDATFKDPYTLEVKSSSGVETLKAKNFILATGSRPVEVPGFKFDEKDILSSTGALDLQEVPKRIVVIGGGYIGLEIGSFLSKLGSEVQVVEAQKSLLAGVVDPECVSIVERKLKRVGVKIHYGAKAKAAKKTGEGLEVEIEAGGKAQILKCDKILVTVGRRPNSDQARLKEIGVQIDEKGFVKVNAQRRTSLPHIFAIGDLCGQPMLAHKASHEGVMVAEILSGQNRVFDAKTVPAVIFVDPEVASAGWTEEEARSHGHKELKVAKFPFAANGKAVSMNEADGFVKMIADAQTHVLLGVHIVGPEASNLISEAALALEMGATLEDIALTIHPHPTLGETMMEAAEAALGHAIHVIQKPLGRSTNGVRPAAN